MARINLLPWRQEERERKTKSFWSWQRQRQGWQFWQP